MVVPNQNCMRWETRNDMTSCAISNRHNIENLHGDEEDSDDARKRTNAHYNNEKAPLYCYEIGSKKNDEKAKILLNLLHIFNSINIL